MSAGDLHEALVVGGLVIILLIAAWALLRASPPAAPVAWPLEEQISDVRHRLVNVEQLMKSLPDHELRLRGVEKEIGVTLAHLTAIREGQMRTERMLELLMEHHLPGLPNERTA